jgi:hypothetical protein
MALFIFPLRSLGECLRLFTDVIFDHDSQKINSKFLYAVIFALVKNNKLLYIVSQK